MHSFVSQEEPESKQAEYGRMQARLERIFAHPDPGYLLNAEADSLLTFQELGLDRQQSVGLFSDIAGRIKAGSAGKKPLPDTEAEIFALFQGTMVGERNLAQILDDKLTGRAALIHSQVGPFLAGTKGPVLDFGAGDLQVTQLLQDSENLRMTGVDVRNYRKKTDATNPVPFSLYDGRTLPFADRSFEAVLSTNVLHHAGETHDPLAPTESNEAAVKELCRVAADRLIVIETVPDPDFMKQDPVAAMERTFWNDYLYNRLFHTADVPVPGRFERLEKWPQRFNAHGWTLTGVRDLGYDQPTIRDYHVLYVFTRRRDVDTQVERARAVMAALAGT